MKKLLSGCLITGGVLFAVLVIIGLIVGPSDRSKSKSAAMADTTTVQPTEQDRQYKGVSPEIAPEILPGLDPWAVVEGMKKKGFSEKVNRYKGMAEYHYALDFAGLDLRADMNIYGSDYSTGVNATAMVQHGLSDIGKAREFFGWLASVYYEGSNPTKARDWAVQQFDQDSSWAILGDGHFLLRAPSPGSRMLFIRRARPWDYPDYVDPE